ncbi:phage major capsid protein [Pseudolysinimonas sp.]
MATETTITSAAAWRPDISTFAPSDVIPDALILLTSTVAGSVEGDAPSVRVAYVDDAAATFTSEGSEIAEANPALSEVLVYTGKVTQLVRLSREQWHQDGAAGMLSESVSRAVVKKANEAYLAQAAPTGQNVTPPAGILNLAGIVDGGAIAGSLDALAGAFATIETNGGQPTHIIAAPDAWGRLRKFKTGATSNSTLLGAGTTDQEKLLLGVPVLTSAAVPSGGLVVVDRTAVVSAVGEVEVAVSEHVYFNSDSIALRCTWRFGQKLVRPTRVAKLTVTDPEA